MKLPSVASFDHVIIEDNRVTGNCKKNKINNDLPHTFIGHWFRANASITGRRKKVCAVDVFIVNAKVPYLYGGPLRGLWGTI